MDFSFARRPAWLLSHFLVLVLIVALFAMGLWQLQRLNDRRDRNERVVERTELPVIAVTDLASGRVAGDTSDLDWRVATATGTFDPDDEMLVVNRSFEGAAGAWVLTPMTQPNGEVVVISRGWIPFSVQVAEDRPLIAAPLGEVTVTGLVQSTQRRGRIGAGNPDDLELLARVDLESFSDRVGYDVAPVYLQLESQSSGLTQLPTPVPRPDLTDGPHLGYAIQWFIFTTIAVFGYPLVLRKVARSRRDDADPDAGSEEHFLAYAESQLR